MTEEQLAAELAFGAAQIAYAAYKNGYDGKTVADLFVELGLKLLPREALMASLTRNGIALAEAAADAAEDVKFPRTP